MTVRGEQYWPPPPAAALWWAVALLALAVPALAGVLGAGRRGGRLVLAGATLVGPRSRTCCTRSARPGCPRTSAYPLMLLSAAGYALLGWPLGRGRRRG